MTTALIIPTFPKVQPKPTKTEIIEALVSRAKVKHDLDEASRIIKRDDLYIKIGKLAAKLAKVKPVDPMKACVHSYREKESVIFSVEVKSPELSDLIKQYKAVEYGSLFDSAATKRQIRDKLAGSPKPCRLLESPEAIKALDAMLETLSK